MKIFNVEKIQNEKGNIFKILDKHKNLNKKFSEIYVTSVKYNQIKAWKKHKITNLHLILLNGKVKVTSYKKNKFQSHILNKPLSHIINVPRNEYFGFKGLSNTLSKILVISDELHDSEEVKSYDINKIKFKW